MKLKLGFILAGLFFATSVQADCIVSEESKTLPISTVVAVIDSYISGKSDIARVLKDTDEIDTNLLPQQYRQLVFDLRNKRMAEAYGNYYVEHVRVFHCIPEQVEGSGWNYY